VNETAAIALPVKAIRAYCETQPIERLLEFASGLDFRIRPDTDIGLLVDYESGATVTLFDMAAHEIDLGEIIGKRVSLSTTKGLRESTFQTPFEIGRAIYEKRT